MSSLILIGTTHETENEKKLFEFLNRFITDPKNYKFKWLCEGESYGRKCVSIKDTKIHLITDILFLNMIAMDMQRDIANIQPVPKELKGIFRPRFLEFLITWNRLSPETKQQVDPVIPKKVRNLLPSLSESSFDSQLDRAEKKIDMVSDWGHLIRKTARNIVDWAIQNSIVHNRWHACMKSFLETGCTCEDTILTELREVSFIQHILQSMLGEDKFRKIFLVTVGEDHLIPLEHFFQKRGIRTYTVTV